MARYAGPNGVEIDFPDSMSEDQVKAVFRRKFAPPAATPEKMGRMAMEGMGPVEQSLAAIGGGMVQTAKQAGNLVGNLAEGATGRRFGMPTDADVEESAKLLAPLEEENFWSSLVGRVAPQVPLMMLGGGGATVKGAGALARLANIGKQAAAGAGQGFIFSDPSQREDNAMLGGALGGAVATVANPLAALAKGALRRADEAAVNLFEPSVERIKEIAAKWGKRGDSLEDAKRRAGRAIRESVDPTTGQRLIAPVEEQGEYALRAGRIGDAGGKTINEVMRLADDMGLRGSPDEIMAQLHAARDAVTGGAEYSNLTRTQRQAFSAINKEIKYFQEVLGPRLSVEPLVGMKPAMTRPLRLPKRDPVTRELVRDATGQPIMEDVIATSKVGAVAPQPTRVFDPPEKIGAIQKKDPKTGRFMKGEPAPQPHLQKSRMVDVPEEATIFTEGPYSGSPTHAFSKTEGSLAPRLPDKLRKRLEKNGIDTTRQLTEDEISNPNIRKMIADAEGLTPTEKRRLLNTGTTLDLEAEAARNTRWTLPQEEVVPERVGIIGGRAKLENPMLSEIEEQGKRMYAKEGFLRKGNAKYRDPSTAEADPLVQWYQRAAGATKGHVEEKLPQPLLEQFLPAKRASQLGEVFGETAEEAAARQMTPRTSQAVRGSPRGALWNTLVTPMVRKSRPYRIMGNELIDQIANMTPHDTDAMLRAIMIEALRSKETR